jgi:hypothetical protein
MFTTGELISHKENAKRCSSGFRQRFNFTLLLRKEDFMKKKAICITVVLLVFFTVGTLFAQTASQVTTWLNKAERDAERAYKLASSKDAKANIDTISDLVKSSVTEIIKVENALNTNEKLYDSNQRDSWLRKMNNIKADLDSVSKLVSMLR